MSGNIDRRKFLTYTGVASTAAATAWVTPSVLGSSSAWATGSCVIKDTIHWSNYTTGSLTGTGVQNLAVPYGTGTYNVQMQVTLVNQPLDGSGYGGWNLNQVRPGTFDGSADNFYGLSMWGNGTGSPGSSFTGTFGFDVTFTWPAAYPAYNLSFSIGDIDYNGSSAFQDRVYVNVAGYTVSNKGSYVSGSGTSVDPWRGTNQATDTGTRGNVTVTYPTTQAINSITISYRNNTSYTGDEQHIGILDLKWCR